MSRLADVNSIPQQTLTLIIQQNEARAERDERLMSRERNIMVTKQRQQTDLFAAEKAARSDMEWKESKMREWLYETEPKQVDDAQFLQRVREQQELLDEQRAGVTLQQTIQRELEKVQEMQAYWRMDLHRCEQEQREVLWAHKAAFSEQEQFRLVDVYTEQWKEFYYQHKRAHKKAQWEHCMDQWFTVEQVHRSAIETEEWEGFRVVLKQERVLRELWIEEIALEIKCMFAEQARCRRNLANEEPPLWTAMLDNFEYLLMFVDEKPHLVSTCWHRLQTHPYLSLETYFGAEIPMRWRKAKQRENQKRAHHNLHKLDNTLLMGELQGAADNAEADSDEEVTPTGPAPLPRMLHDLSVEKPVKETKGKGKNRKKEQPPAAPTGVSSTALGLTLADVAGGTPEVGCIMSTGEVITPAYQPPPSRAATAPLIEGGDFFSDTFNKDRRADKVKLENSAVVSASSNFQQEGVPPRPNAPLLPGHAGGVPGHRPLSRGTNQNRPRSSNPVADALAARSATPDQPSWMSPPSRPTSNDLLASLSMPHPAMFGGPPRTVRPIISGDPPRTYKLPSALAQPWKKTNALPVAHAANATPFKVNINTRSWQGW
eukprot:TRINITY_DN67764_c7_g2_i1.p1 TRINITY_DN67764_c7_g2~~TRINITY_DN67764_c7_g2_i1.p1  ORF type:complete len:601 (-),score=73.21 TRINITY_DN67764_c7_g2_i1:368-2170(-)